MTRDSITAPEYSFEVIGDAETTWQVRRFRLDEGLSRPYSLSVDLLTENLDLDPGELLGADAQFYIDRRDVMRLVCGVIERVDYIGVNLDDKLALRVHVVPALALLKQQVGCRIYQDLTLPELLDEVLCEALGAFGRDVDTDGLCPDAAVYPKRDYCVQFRESTLDFVGRLMEEDGITYHFVVVDGKEKLVLTDHSGAGTNQSFSEVEIIDPDGLGMIPIITDRPELADRESLRFFDWCQPLRPDKVVVRSFNWKAFDPSQPLEAAAAAAGDGASRRQFVFTDQRKIVDEKAGSEPTSNFSGASIDEAGLDVQRRFELFQSETKIGRGRSNVIGFAPGLRFVADDQALPVLDEYEFLLTRVTHQGEDPGVERSGGGDGARYENAFECIPVAHPHRPARVTQRPRIFGPQTATVTGAGEIDTDKHGRIKVRFHWDEHSPLDGSSSCWVRVAQSWAGAGWGTLFIPRVGMEVVVEFLDGNPDRPLVTGCVYNSANTPPYTLPDEKTKSTIKSESSSGGGGFNELRFEDMAGAEEVFLHAQKDLNEKVLNVHTTSVGSDQCNTVGRNQSNEVKGNQTEMIDGNQEMTIGGNRKVQVKGDFEETIDGTETRTVKGDVTETFAANETRDIAGEQTETIGGSVTRTITGGQSDAIRGSLSQDIMGGVSVNTPATYDVTAAGGITMTAAAGIKMVAPGGFTVVAPGGTKTIDNSFCKLGGQLFQVFSEEFSYENFKCASVLLDIKFSAFSGNYTAIKHSRGVVEFGNKAIDMRTDGTKLKSFVVGVMLFGMVSMG